MPLHCFKQHTDLLSSHELLSIDELFGSRRPLPHLPGFVLLQALYAHRKQLIHSGLSGQLGCLLGTVFNVCLLLTLITAHEQVTEGQ